MHITVNGKTHPLGPNEKHGVLLTFLREMLSLTGSKYGCGLGQCGACTVLIDNKAVRSCVTPLSTVVGKKVTTIEGLADLWPGEDLHPVQKAFYEEQVPQCGFCASGQIMRAVALFNEKPNPTTAEIETAMSGNLCRCGTYPRIRRALLSVQGYADAGKDR